MIRQIALFLCTPLLFIQPGFSQIQLTLGNDTSSTIKPLLGVNAGPQPQGESTFDLTSVYKTAGVTMIRVHDYPSAFEMSTMYPNQSADPAKDSSYNWTTSDTAFQKIIDGGFEPYIRIGDSASSPKPVTNTPNWAAAAVVVIRRYSDSARWGRNAIRFVEIYNEPDNPTFWNAGGPAFQQLYITTSKAIKAAFPAIKVGGCGFTQTSFQFQGGGGFVRSFLAAANAAGAPLDFLSWHTYSNNPADYVTGAQYFRGLAVQYGYPNAESILSEWNTDFEGPSGADANLRTGARGSSILTADWINLQSTDVVYAHLYRGPDSSPNLTTFYGMWYTDGRPKPAALALTLFSQVARYSTKTDVTSSSADLSVLAAKNSAGERVVLIANNTASASSWKISGNTGQNTIYKLQEISGSAASITSATLSSLASAIPAYGVQMVTLTASGPPSLITGVGGAGNSVPAVTTITPNGYFTIYGSGFAASGTSRFVQSSDIVNNTFPTNLGGVCVNVGSDRAFLRYVSATQINALTPAVSQTSVPVSVVLNCGTASETISASVNVSVAAAAPEFLYWIANANGQNPVIATQSLTGTYLGAAGLLAGSTFSPAKAGDLITLYGISFGATTPAQVPGVASSVVARLTNGATVTVGGVNAAVSYAGISPGNVGLYQINITVPSGLSAGSQPVTATLNGLKAAAGGTLAIQ